MQVELKIIAINHWRNEYEKTSKNNQPFPV
jgi:hypothetical protein